MKISDYVESQIKGLWGTDFDENGIPVIKTNNLTYEGNIDYSEICKRNITKEQAKGCYLRPGDLLIEKSGGTKTHSVGYVSYFEGDENKFVCNNFILALRPMNTINSKFLFYQIQFKYESNQFSDCFNKTTGIQNLKVKDYLAKEIKIYSSEEQEKIVKELDTVRSTINKNKQILEKYDTLIKSRFIEMFGDSVTNSKNWNLKKLGDLLESIRYGTSTPPVFSETGYAFIRATNIKKGKIVNDDMKYISEEEAKKISKCKLNGNEILIVRSGVNSGDTCVVTKEYINQYAGYDMILVLGNQINPIYLNELLNTNYMEKMIKPLTRRAAQPHLNSEQTQSLPIILPPLSLQNDFAAFVHQIDKSKFEYTNIGVAA